jgi:CO dehydrogenase nickel-insertion accessory protein CooC1
MSTIFMSPKGGNGTTVTATAYALLMAAHGTHTVLIDLCGDVPAAAGMAEPTTPGVNDWLSESSLSDAQALVTLGTPFDNGLVVVHRGSSFVEGQPRWSDLANAITTLPMNIVIDAGITFLPEELRRAVTHVTMVVKPCYLSLRRASRMQRPTQLFVVCEESRALTVKDVGHVLGMPVTSEIPYTPAISRAVDAGMLPSRAEQLFGPYMTLS